MKYAAGFLRFPSRFMQLAIGFVQFPSRFMKYAAGFLRFLTRFMQLAIGFVQFPSRFMQDLIGSAVHAVHRAAVAPCFIPLFRIRSHPFPVMGTVASRYTAP